MNIETKTETIIQTQYVLTLTEAEVAAALVDPASLQQALRDSRAGVARQGPNARKSITLTAGRHVRQAPAGKKERAKAGPKVRAGRGVFTKEPCAKCGKPIARTQMRRHLSACQGTAAAESA